MIQRILILAAISVLVGCATFGLPTPESFEERLASGYVTVTGVRNLAGTLLEAGKITAADARNIQNSADVGRQGLEVSELVYETNPDEGKTRLDATLIGINALMDYLEKRNGRGQSAPGSGPTQPDSDLRQRPR